MKYKLLIKAIFLVHFTGLTQTHAQSSANHNTQMNINNFALRIHNDGLVSSTNNIPIAVTFPAGKVDAVYTDGLIWGGIVHDGQEPRIRAGGTYYESGMQPRRIFSGGVAEPVDSTSQTIWRIRRDWLEADLRRDASLFYGTTEDSVTAKQIEQIRAQYRTDWRAWPVEKGAPFYDANGDGIYTPRFNPDGSPVLFPIADEPGLAAADQVIWLVINDLDSTKTTALFGSPPIGIEMQMTFWAYNYLNLYGTAQLKNTIFKRYRLIYKGTAATPGNAQIDSLHLANYTDVNIGSFGDDMAGCDTTLDLGFGYNGSEIDAQFLLIQQSPTAIGNTIVQGPLQKKAQQSSAAIFNFQPRNGYINLPMTAFRVDWAGDDTSHPNMGQYDGTLQLWNILRSFRARPISPLIPRYDPEGNIVKFIFPGDPVTGSGWLSYHPSSHSFWLITGPFNMALGDTNEVIIAMVGGHGSSRLASVSAMKLEAKWARFVAKHNFALEFESEINEETATELPRNFILYQNRPNPFTESTTIEYDIAVAKHVKIGIINIYGQEVKQLVNAEQPAGHYSILWDGRTNSGQTIATGINLCQIQAGGFSETKKMLVVR